MSAKTLGLVALAMGAAAILIARALHRSAASTQTAAAAGWSDVPSAPDGHVPGSSGTELPIERYDQLRAVDIAKSVRRLKQREEVQQVLDYEQAHHQRVTVFKAARARLRALEAADPAAAR